jgi:hypothetical protein
VSIRARILVARLAADLQHVREAQCRDQADAGTAAFQHRVGGGGVVDKPRDLCKADALVIAGGFQPVSTARLGLLRVVEIFASRTAPSEDRQTTSVNVPPISMPNS